MSIRPHLVVVLLRLVLQEDVTIFLYTSYNFRLCSSNLTESWSDSSDPSIIQNILGYGRHLLYPFPSSGYDTDFSLDFRFSELSTQGQMVK